MRTVLAVFILVASLIAGGSLVSAQDSTQEATIPTHPAFVHEGDCTNLTSNPAATLDDVTVRNPDEAGDEDAPEPQGALDAPMVLHSDSTADISLDDLLAEPHSIAIRASAEETDVVLACGSIGGLVQDDELYIALAPQDDSGFYGIAKLSKDDDGTQVEIFLVQPNESGAATPVA
jgi:hypothetical protein